MIDRATALSYWQRLLSEGGFVFPDDSERRLMVFDGRFVSGGKPCVVVAYEGGGAFVYDFDRPLNPFRLIKSGFSGAVAEAASELLNELFTILTTTERDQLSLEFRKE
jgi:hypothetical protein